MDAWRPARLKVFVTEIQVITFLSAPGAARTAGVCFFPWKIRSEWISSETTSTSFSKQIVSILSSSSFVHTRPRGLWGLQRMKSFTSGSFACLSKSSKSTSHTPSRSRKLFCTRVLPVFSVISKNSGYTGGWIKTFSPFWVNSLMIPARAGTTPRLQLQRDGSNFQPFLLSCQSAYALK